MKKLVLLYLISFSCFSAFAGESADELKPEWRLIGPSFSRHDTLDGAPITKPQAGVFDCRVETNGGYACDGRTTEGERKWSETNPSFGVEYSRLSHPGATSRDKAFVAMVRDSFGSMSLLAGLGRSWPLASFGTISVATGVSGGLWYRTVNDGDVVGGKIQYCFINDRLHGNSCVPGGNDYYVKQLKRTIVPFVLPFLELTEKTTGLGMNIALAPKLQFGNYSSVPTTTLMVQLTYKLNF